MKRKLAIILALTLTFTSLPATAAMAAEAPGAAEETVSSADTAAGSAGNADVSDAVQALVALGYSNSEALRAVKKVKIQEGMDTQEILKNALRFIGL